MKSVIVEIRGNTAILLSDDGCITKVKNKNYYIGQEVQTNMKIKFSVKKFATIAAAACFVLIIGTGAYAYYTPTAYVSFDVNPSIEYGVNIFDTVVSAKGVNDDGSNIINEIDLKNLINKNINEAIALTIDQVAQEGYLSYDNSGIVITTSMDDMEKADELAQELSETANGSVDENGLEVEVAAEAVGKQRVLEARELGVTPGKLNLVQKLQASAEDPESIDINEWLTKPVREIMSEIKQNKEFEKNSAEDTQNKDQNDNSSDNGSGKANDNSFNSKNGNSKKEDNGSSKKSVDSSITAPDSSVDEAQNNDNRKSSSNASDKSSGNNEKSSSNAFDKSSDSNGKSEKVNKAVGNGSAKKAS